MKDNVTVRGKEFPYTLLFFTNSKDSLTNSYKLIGMARYFTVDREMSLRPNLLIKLVKYSDVKPQELQKHVNALFPQGVTSHGERYLLRGKTSAKGVSATIELLFEYVRRSLFPSHPSRFQSFFAYSTLKDAEAFKNQYGKPNSLIWEVEADNEFKADMRLLTLKGSLLVLSYNAHRYWSGLPSGDEPCWEFLLVPPVIVIRQINCQSF